MLTNSTALISETQLDVVLANAQIMQNAGIPTEDGKTTNWCEVKQAYQQSFFYIIKPEIDGWNGISQETMMQDVVGVTEEFFNTDWNLPISPPEEK